MSRIEIRPASVGDFDAWRELWRGYLAFYETALPDGRTELTWSRILDRNCPIYCLLAVDGSAVQGFATYLTHPSTWLDGDDCYLEDLFVASDLRGGGVGKSLIEAVRDAARTLGCERLYWSTNADNRRARGLYDKLAGPSDAVRYRMPVSG